jgi:hypothetical protein
MLDKAVKRNRVYSTLMSLLGVENVIVDKSRSDLKKDGFRSEVARSEGKGIRERGR